MSRFEVRIDHNFHDRDPTERYTYHTFATAEEAVACCKRIVDNDLEGHLKPGISADDVHAMWMKFGDTPFVVPTGPDDAGDPSRWNFNASEYAKERAAALCG